MIRPPLALLLPWGCGAPLPTGYEAADKSTFDPTVTTATFTPSGDEFDRNQGARVASDGTTCTAGNTQSPGLGTQGVFQEDLSGDGDALVCCFDADLRTTIFCTYIGGTGAGDDRAYDLDLMGDLLVVVGQTTSDDFPTTTGAYQTDFGGDRDIFVSVFDMEGQLEASTYVGGVAYDGSRGQVRIGRDGIYVSGQTDGSGFPGTASGFDATYNGGTGDAILAKLDFDLGGLQWATYIGGSGEDAAAGMMLLGRQNTVYVGGSTDSDDLPTTSGAFQTTFGGDSGTSGYAGDAWAGHFASDGSRLELTYFGGSAVDSMTPNSGAVYDRGLRQLTFAGGTESPNLPIPSSGYQSGASGDVDGYVVTMSEDLSDALYGARFGGGGVEEPSGVEILEDHRVVVGGSSQSDDMPVTANAAQGSFGGGKSNAMLQVFAPDLSTLDYATYWGGSGDPVDPDYGDRGRDVEIGPNGEIVLCGDADSVDFPTTSNAMIPDHSGGRSDAYLLVLSPP